jgi:1,4-alpha-glucan branching enzyme
MTRIYFFLASLSIFICSKGQVITTTPALPIDNQPVTITFDATQGNKGLVGFTGDVYAYTGVITDKSTSNSNWLYVKESSWTDNLASCKMTRIDANHYSLTISPSIREFYGVPAGEKIKKLAFVFHCPCPPTGEPSGRDIGNADILVDVYEATLNVSIAKPTNFFSLVQESLPFDVVINASDNDSITLFIDNTEVITSRSQSLTYSITPTGNQKHTIIAIASKGSQTVSDTAYYLVKGNTPNLALPSGANDGITYPDDQSATFVLFAPHKKNVYLFGDFNNWTPDNTYLMNKDGDRFWLTVNGLTPGKEYVFQYLIDDSIRIADPYCEKISDPANDKDISSTIYPNLIAYPNEKTTEITGVIQPGQTHYNWQVSNFTPPAKEKLVVYELLIRDFTDQRDVKTITDTIPYLKRLGVNAIELMPFNEFEGNDSWGYNPSFYFAPDKAYGTKNDYKKFIDACHQNGIAVIQDLVLNHSYGSSPLVRMYFANGAPTPDNPWYNQTSNIKNPSLQFGYDFNHNSIYTQKLVDSVASFWMSEYKIDGFRYDFTKGFSNTPYGSSSWASEYDTSRIRILKRMANAVWQRKPSAYMIFEHLTDNTEETELANAGIMLWGNLNYNYGQATMGYPTGWDFSWISYKNRGWNSPNVMGYMESHDEERLIYKNLTYGNSWITYNIKDLTTALKRMEMAATFFYTVPGPKMMWEFGELGYDVSIDQGGRLSVKPPHWEYYNVPARKHLFDITRAMIKLKKEEPIFSTNTFTLNTTGAVKQIELLDASTQVEIIGNFDISDQAYTLNFPSAGTWYEFFKGDSLTTTSAPLILKAGEYRLYSNKKLTGFASIPTAIKPITGHTGNMVYPNPFSSRLYINDYAQVKQLKILNEQGKTIWLSKNLTSNIIDTSDLPSGLYIISIQEKNGEERLEKVVKF